MDQCERLKALIKELCTMNQYKLPELPDEKDQLFKVYRALVNTQQPTELDDSYSALQDAMLKAEIKERGIKDIHDFPKGISVWQGDITTLNADAIVNAANQQLLGCFIPNHSCIDNAIHTYAGLQLRNECNALMKNQGVIEPIGKAKITHAYNLPCQYVIHTVGPCVNGKVSEKDRYLLRSCYISCLQAASSLGLKSIAFCCISTGVFHFPNELAAQIAVAAVKEYMPKLPLEKVIFDVFTERDQSIYEQLINA